MHLGRKRVLYLQYANPAAYPPLEHSSRILAENGCQVLVLGVGSRGTEALRFPPHPEIEVRLRKYCPPGWRQKIHFGRFVLLALCHALRWRPHWVYGSDILACPALFLLSRFCKTIYHEHDFPKLSYGGCGDPQNPMSLFMQFAQNMRNRAARRAQFCVVPNHARGKLLAESTGTKRPIFTVWNCPSRGDAAPLERRRPQFTVYYHGNIGPELVPVSLFEAVAALSGVRLLIVGYSTDARHSHVETLGNTAKRLSIEDRVEIRSAQSRADLLAVVRTAHVGWAVIPDRGGDINFRHMVGASNKAFDYLACGIPLLVSNLPEWKETFVAPGYALACRSSDAESIARSLRWFMEHPEEAREMGERGRQRILADWNYEVQFQKVQEKMMGTTQSHT